MRGVALYWRVRWALWDRQEHRLVAEIARRMRGVDELLVHEYEGEAPTWVVARVARSHGHIEGAKR